MWSSRNEVDTLRLSRNEYQFATSGRIANFTATQSAEYQTETDDSLNSPAESTLVDKGDVEIEVTELYTSDGEEVLDAEGKVSVQLTDEEYAEIEKLCAEEFRLDY